MKPCPEYQQDISLLQAGALSSAESAHVRAHLTRCAGCQEYAEQMSALCDDLAEASTSVPQLEPSSGFHQRLLRRLQSEAQPKLGVFQSLRHWVVEWRPGILTGATGLAALIILATLPRQASMPSLNPSARQTAEGRRMLARLQEQPTYSSYRLAANVSLEKLDELLTAQAGRGVQGGETFTAGRQGL